MLATLLSSLNLENNWACWLSSVQVVKNKILNPISKQTAWKQGVPAFIENPTLKKKKKKPK